MNKAVIITGACGGIGSALINTFNQNGYFVIATDVKKTTENFTGNYFIQADLDKLVESNEYQKEFFNEVFSALHNLNLFALINNAALQIIKSTEELEISDWKRTLNINLVAPYLLTSSLLSKLEIVGGSVVNIASIHATLTKPNFVCYATSKAALVGLTRSMAVDLGRRIRVNAIAPAAIETPMLKESFNSDLASYQNLSNMHPIGRVGQAIEVADLALFLVSEKAAFINGAVIQLDGGIASRLHDLV